MRVRESKRGLWSALAHTHSHSLTHSLNSALPEGNSRLSGLGSPLSTRHSYSLPECSQSAAETRNRSGVLWSVWNGDMRREQRGKNEEETREGEWRRCSASSMQHLVCNVCVEEDDAKVVEDQEGLEIKGLAVWVAKAAVK